MSHWQQVTFFELVKKYYPSLFSKVSVLEVGSLDINGSIRPLFDQECKYIGADLEIGKGVDIAVPGQLIDLPSQSIDVVVSTECFEHNPCWIETLANMLRMMKPDGAIIITCASYGRGEHGTERTRADASPFTVRSEWSRYYKNLCAKDFNVVDLTQWLSSYYVFEGGINDLLFIGFGKHSNFSIGADFKNEVQVQLRPSFSRICRRKLNIVLGNRIYLTAICTIKKWIHFNNA